MIHFNFRCGRKIVLGENSVTDTPNGDRFKIVIPYAGHSITCKLQIIFPWKLQQGIYMSYYLLVWKAVKLESV